MTSKIFVVGLSYKTAPVALREKLAVTPADQAHAAEGLKAVAGLSEVVLLWTCNRVEIYGVTDRDTAGMKKLMQHLTPYPLDLEEQIYLHEGQAAVEHLFHVTGGMESMVLGEPEITGQVKSAYEAAQARGQTGKFLNKTFQKALQTAKAIRTDTGIGQGATSVGSVCVMRAEELLGADLSKTSVLVIGAGKMAETCVRHFAKRGAHSIIVANRSLDHARELAHQFEGRAVHFDYVLHHMAEADIVVTSTGCPVTILQKEELAGVMAKRNGRPLFIIDIAVPRDIDPAAADIPGLFLDDIDALQDTVKTNIRHRHGDMADCRAIIESKVETLFNSLRRTGKPGEAHGNTAGGSCCTAV